MKEIGITGRKSCGVDDRLDPLSLGTVDFAFLSVFLFAFVFVLAYPPIFLPICLGLFSYSS